MCILLAFADLDWMGARSESERREWGPHPTHSIMAKPTSEATEVEDGTKNYTACFVFPEASGHINASLALSARLCKKGWKVHYLSAEVMKQVRVRDSHSQR